MKAKIIDKDPKIKELFLNRNLRESSKKSYLLRIGQYCTFTGKTPTELIDEAIEDEENRVRMMNRRIKKQLLDFRAHLEETNKSPNFTQNAMTVIRSFYSEFEIELPKSRSNRKKEEKLSTTKDIPDKDDIKKVLKYANPKYKAMILLMMSSGMGSAEIRELRFSDLLKSYEIPIKDPFDIDKTLHLLKEKRNTVGTWSIRRIKTRKPYVTFNSPESMNAIIDYLDFRIDNQHPIQSPDDWLFEALGHQVSSRGMLTAFIRLNDRVGFGFYDSHRFFHRHSLRKYFASTCQNNEMDYLDAERLIGHKVPELAGIYIKPEISRLKREYLKVLSYLSLEPVETVTLESDEVKQLKNNYENRFKEKDEEMESMKKRMSEMEDTLQKTVDKQLDK